jgi:hypothetical protein
MSFGYSTQYANGLNSNTQIRRSTDMIYQRGATYEVVMTGFSYQSSMELDVDMYVNDSKVGRMSVVPYSVTQYGAFFTYRFNIRPYDYLSNYVQSQHYGYYWLNDWDATNTTININNPYPNSIKANFKYGYRYSVGSSIITEYTDAPTNDFDHYTDVSTCYSDTSFVPSGFTNTGEYFNYVGGAFQLDEKYILRNFDQEIGTVVGTGLTINTIDVNRRLSPMGQFLLDFPMVPEESETSRFLTDSPRILSIQSNENYVLYFLNGQTGDRQVIEADYALFEFYNVNNTLIAEFNLEINKTGTIYESPTGYTDTLQVFGLPCGPTDISNIYSTIPFDQVAYYTVQLFYSYPSPNTNRQVIGPVGPCSERFYFYVNQNCGPEDFRVGFLNMRGGFDYYTFTAFRQDSKKITRQTYDSRYYATNLSSPDRDYARTVKTFDTDVTQEIVVESDYINVETGEWLQQLFMSPQVYEMRPDFVSPMDRQDKIYKDLRPLQVVSTEVDTITKKHKKLNKYRITFKRADSFFVSKGF